MQLLQEIQHVGRSETRKINQETFSSISDSASLRCVSDGSTYLVAAALRVDEHQQRLHELRGEGLHQEGLPAAILELRDRSD